MKKYIFKIDHFRKLVRRVVIVFLVFMPFSVDAYQEKQNYNVRASREYLIRAEEYKQEGDPRAQSFYLKAIRTYPEDPEYYILFADYLRNFRGPGQPLFAQAEKNYYIALKKN